MLEWLATRVEFVCLDTLWFCIVCSVPRYDLQSFALGSPLPTLSLSLQEQSRPSRLLRPPSIIFHLFWQIVHSHRTSELVYRLGLPAFIRSPGRAGFDSRIRNTDFSSFLFCRWGLIFAGFACPRSGWRWWGRGRGRKGRVLGTGCIRFVYSFFSFQGQRAASYPSHLAHCDKRDEVVKTGWCVELATLRARWARKEGLLLGKNGHEWQGMGVEYWVGRWTWQW